MNALSIAGKANLKCCSGSTGKVIINYQLSKPDSQKSIRNYQRSRLDPLDPLDLLDPLDPLDPLWTSLWWSRLYSWLPGEGPIAVLYDFLILLDSGLA